MFVPKLMNLNTPTALPSPPRRNVPLAWFVVGIVVAAGLSVTGVAVVYADRTNPPPGPITITDDLGRQVSVPDDPAHVVVLARLGRERGRLQGRIAFRLDRNMVLRTGP